jgi:chromosome segregation ATPase
LELVVEKIMDLEGEIRSLPSKIKDAEKNLHRLSCEISRVKKALEASEARVMREITSELNSEGKPRYRNEASRQAELQARLGGDENYKGLKAREEELHETLEMEKIELNYLRNCFSALKYITRLRGSDDLG